MMEKHELVPWQRQRVRGGSSPSHSSKGAFLLAFLVRAFDVKEKAEDHASSIHGAPPTGRYKYVE